MPTGLVAQTLVDPLQDNVFFLVTILFHGLRSDRLQSLARLLRRSTELLPMQLLKQFGCVNYLRSFIGLSIRPLWFIVIIFLQSIWQAIQCNIDVPSTLRSTFTSFRRRLRWDKYVFFMSLLQHNLPTYSPRGFHHHHLLIFDSVSTSSSLPLILWGGC